MAGSSNIDNHRGFRNFQGHITVDVDHMRIPDCFVKHWKDEIKREEDCLLFDPKNNHLVFAIEIHREEVGFFIDGIRWMIQFYGLKKDHVARFRYCGSNFFWIRVYDLNGKEISYPEYEKTDTNSGDSFFEGFDQDSNKEAEDIFKLSSSNEDREMSHSSSDDLMELDGNSWTMTITGDEMSRSKPPIL